jgi:hypothetical protein
MAYQRQNGAHVDEADLVPEFLRQRPECPAGGTYTFNVVGVDPTCSIAGNHSM